MDPLSIICTAFSLASGISKALMAITEFTRNAQNTTKAIDSISKELQALTGILDPLAHSLSQVQNGRTLPDCLIRKMGDALSGCDLVVKQITENLHKYQRDKVWTKAKWALFGQGDVLKLRESLEAYNMALSLGLHAISMYSPLPLSGFGYC